MHCDLDLWPFDPKIYRAHPWLMGRLHVKFHDDRCKKKVVMRRKPFSVIYALWPWPFDLKIYRAHPCLMGSLHVKFHDDTVPLPANFNYPRDRRGLPTSVHSDVLRGHLYLYRCPCWLRNQPATWPWRRGGHLCQVACGDYIITLRNTASFAQLPVYPICWTSVNKISCWTRLLTSFNCEYGVEWMVDL